MNNPIQINRKLMEREDLLVEVFDLERQINVILGGKPYPFAPPDGLPSLQKRKKPKRKAAPKAAPAVRLRKLDPATEYAYRVEYIEKGEAVSEIHFDARPIALLVNTELPDTRVVSVQTVARNPDGGYDPVETLLQRESDRSETA